LASDIQQISGVDSSSYLKKANSTFALKAIDSKQGLKLLNSLDNSKATGHDHIPNKILESLLQLFRIETQ